MQIAVVGGSRGLGREIVSRAIDVGYSVAVLARRPGKLGRQRSKLSVTEGDVLDRQAVKETLRGTEAVFVSLGRTPGNPRDVVSRGTSNVIFTMQELGIRRLIVVSALGVGDSKSDVSLPYRVLLGTALRASPKEKAEQERLVRASKLDWTIIRPARLTDAPATGRYYAGLQADCEANSVSRKDVAEFALSQLADRTFLREAPAIC